MVAQELQTLAPTAHCGSELRQTPFAQHIRAAMRRGLLPRVDQACRWPYLPLASGKQCSPFRCNRGRCNARRHCFRSARIVGNAADLVPPSASSSTTLLHSRELRVRVPHRLRPSRLLESVPGFQKGLTGTDPRAGRWSFHDWLFSPPASPFCINANSPRAEARGL